MDVKQYENFEKFSKYFERFFSYSNMVVMYMAKKEDTYEIVHVSDNIANYGIAKEQLCDQEDAFGLICPEDVEDVRREIKEAVSKHKEDSRVECRLVTDEWNLIPIRLMMRYIYDEDDNLTAIESLMYDRQEEIRQNSENTYLSHAIFKMKSVVLIKSYKEGKRSLKYISPNAEMVGMNVEALVKGYKLTEDYIHPDDRDKVIDTIYQAVASGVTDYEHVYRMVRDDGRQIWVHNELTVTRVSDGEAEISFLLTDITEIKSLEQELSAVLDAEGDNARTKGEDGSSLSLFTIDEEDEELLKQFRLMAESLSRNADYYSVVLDAEGKQLTKPAGPANSLGMFYDLFERPQLKEQFEQATMQIKQQRIPKSVSFTIDQMPVHMIFAPLMRENTVTAYWVLTSFAKDGAQQLGEAIGDQWQLANAIVKSSYAEEVVQREQRQHKLTKMHLRKAQKEREIIQELLNSVAKDGESSLGEICQKVGMHLSLADIGIYLENKENGNVETYFTWDYAGEDNAVFSAVNMSEAEYQVLVEQLKDKTAIIAERGCQDAFLKGKLQQSRMETVLFHKLVSTNGMEGYAVFTRSQGSEKFHTKDVEFISCVAHILETVACAGRGTGKIDIVKEGFLEAYDYIKDAVFVKDNKSGDIIFANKAMDKLFGYSLVGMAASEVVNDQLERYRDVQGMRKRFIANKKVSKWQSYMKELNQIMNIVEIHMDMLSGQDCSLFILKKNKRDKS